MGERVVSMILNGLGYTDVPLYMYPDFLAKTPIKRLIGRDVDPMTRDVVSIKFMSSELRNSFQI